MLPARCLWALLVCAWAVGASDAPVDMKKVQPLTDDTFQRRTDSGNWFIMFYAPWCGHCKRLKPVFANLSIAEEVTKGDHLHLAMVDCTVEKRTCDAHGIKGYPGLRYTTNSVSGLMEYKGGRDLTAFRIFARRLLVPHHFIAELDSQKEFDELVDQTNPKVSVVLSLPGTIKEHKATAKAFQAAYVRAAWVSTLRFGIFPNSQKATATITLYNDVDTHDFEGSVNDPKALAEWIEEHRFLTVEELDSSNFFAIGRQGKWMSILIYNKLLGSQYLGELRAVALTERYREKFTFGQLDGIFWEPWVTGFNIKPEQFPFYIVYAAEDELYFLNNTAAAAIGVALNESRSEDAVHLMEEFLQRVLDGKESVRALGFMGYVNMAKRMFLDLPIGAQITLAGIVVSPILLLIFWCIRSATADGEEEAEKPEKRE